MVFAFKQTARIFCHCWGTLGTPQIPPVVVTLSVPWCFFSSLYVPQPQEDWKVLIRPSGFLLTPRWASGCNPNHQSALPISLGAVLSFELSGLVYVGQCVT